MNSRERRALRNYKADHKFDALAAPAPPPVELDEAFYLRVDLAEPSGWEKASRDYERALDAQLQRQGATS